MNIYLITNKKTGEQYVGQTKLNIYERWGRHILDAYRADRGVANNQKSDFHKAIVKYTPEVFKVELLDECSEQEVNKKERFWIKELDTYNNGYNMTKGGQDYFKQDNPSYKRFNKTGDFVEDTYNDIIKYEERNTYETSWDILKY